MPRRTAPDFFDGGCQRAPADRVSAVLEAGLGADRHERHVGHHVGVDQVPGVEAVSPAELERIHADCIGHFVDMHFAREHRLRMPEAAELTADRRARVDAVAVVPVVRNPVGRDHALPGNADDGRPARGVATRSGDRLALERRDRSVLLHAGLQIEDERIARVFGEEQFFEGVLEPDRPAGPAGTAAPRYPDRASCRACRCTCRRNHHRHRARSRARSCDRVPVQGRSFPARRTRSVASPRTSRSRLAMTRRRHGARSAHDTGSA